MNAAEIAALTAHGIELIAKIVNIIADAKAGKLDPADALSKIGEAHATILADRAKVDAEIAADFPTPAPTP